MVNLDSSRGLIVGEAVMMGIAPLVGRNAAHDIVYEACKDCIEDIGHQSTLLDKLLEQPAVTNRMSREELAKLCDPRNYLGACQQMVDDVLRSRAGLLAVDGFAKKAINGHVNGTKSKNGVDAH